MAVGCDLRVDILQVSLAYGHFLFHRSHLIFEILTNLYRNGFLLLLTVFAGGWVKFTEPSRLLSSD